MEREIYKQLFEEIQPSEQLVERVQKAAEGKASGCGKRKKRSRRLLIGAAAACLCIFVGLPVLTANARMVYEFFYIMSPNAAQFFMPVRKSCVSNGIRMEVESVSVQEGRVDLYVSMQDLTGDRIDETMDLYDSYAIHQAFGNVGTCEKAGFDPETKKVTFLIQIADTEKEAVPGDKITFSVSEFLSNKQIYRDIEIPIDLSQVPEAGEMHVPEEHTGGGGMDTETVQMLDTFPVLVPGEPMEEFPVEGMELVAMGYVDGRLHIQTAQRNRLENDNHGYFYLLNEAGEEIHHDYSVGYAVERGTPEEIDYEEQVFEITREELGKCKLYGSFWICEGKTEGWWQVTFPIGEASE